MSAESPQALILAAGKGTRMRSQTAKVLQPALGLPLLEHVLRAVAAVGADPVTIVLGHQADAVEAAFEGRATFVRQEPPLGTGHAVQVARAAFAAQPGRALLVVNADQPLLTEKTLRRLLEGHRGSGAAATLLTAVLEDAGAYGRVVRDAGGVRAIVEARDASAGERALREINAGVYVFDVPSLLGVLQRLEPQNAQGEYYLTDVVSLLAGSGKAVQAVVTDDPREALGVNSFAELAAASRALRERRLEELMAAGVRVEDPASVHVGLDVTVEPGASIRGYCFLEGRTSVRAGASVGPFARLVDCDIGPEAQILDHCLILESVVEAGASVGPFAHIRPASRIGRRAKVGNFVELKKTLLGEGSKAPHLSYLGDAVIGPSVNVGAGTITCNYDGQAKHPTRIEQGAFIGSDTTLVAPVTIGEGAYIAAGSTITEDVPAGALAISRKQQENKEGWVQRRRERQARQTSRRPDEAVVPAAVEGEARSDLRTREESAKAE